MAVNVLNAIHAAFVIQERRNNHAGQFQKRGERKEPKERREMGSANRSRESWDLFAALSSGRACAIVNPRLFFRSPPPLPRITRSRTFSAAARERRPISWQRRSKGRSASEARRSSRTTDRRIRSPTFTVRSGRTRTIRRRITTSWRWLTSPDAASSRETWVIERSSELRGIDFYAEGGGRGVVLLMTRRPLRFLGLVPDVAQTEQWIAIGR